MCAGSNLFAAAVLNRVEQDSVGRECCNSIVCLVVTGRDCCNSVATSSRNGQFDTTLMAAASMRLAQHNKVAHSRRVMYLRSA